MKPLKRDTKSQTAISNKKLYLDNTAFRDALFTTLPWIDNHFIQ